MSTKMRIQKYYRVIVLLLEGAALCFGTACGKREETVSEERTENDAAPPFAGEQEAAGAADMTGTASMAGTTGMAGTADMAGAADWTEEQLFQADFLLYNVNCASEDTSVFPEDQICGLCQSVSDQPYGKDPGSGRTWGYREADYLLREQDSLGEGLTASKWNMDETLYQGGEESSICYDFQLPRGDYQVTIGFYDPFGPRKIDVDCEGERMVKGEKLLRFRLTEKQFDVRVEDGELNLKVFNEEGKRAMDMPILSYVQIAAVPEYTGSLLELALQKYAAEGWEDIYTEASCEVYRQAVTEAEELLEQMAEAKELPEQTAAEQETPEQTATEQETSGQTASGKETPEQTAAEGRKLQQAGPYAEACENKFKQLKEGYEQLVKKYRYDSFLPGEQWRDTENELIQAHGGQVQQLPVRDETTGEMVPRWVWVGEDKTKGARGGIRAYSSEDLYNWQSEGIIMRNVSSRESLETEDYFKELYAGYTQEQLDNVFRSLDAEKAIIERPKLIYNEKTGKYVLWFHADGPTESSDSSYAAACAGVAVSDTPFGPYRFIDRYRLNVCPEDQEDKYPSSRGMARDMNLFVDSDGTAYIIYSSEENLTLYISKLNDEYTYLATPPEEAVYGEDFIRLYPGAQREAPAVFQKDGKYYLLSSGCTGWAPNQARYYMSDSMMGEWVNMGDPCIGDTAATTFNSQSTCVFEGPSGELIYMGDRWNSDKLSDSRYIWLPVTFSENGEMELRWQEEWRYQ